MAAKRELNVFLYGQRIGVLEGRGNLITGFRYRHDYEGPRLSCSMPISRRNVGRLITAAWFDGILPEGGELRQAMAVAHESRDTSSMGLLECAGLDCAGAVQLTPHSELDEREQFFEPMSERVIGERLRSVFAGLPVAERTERWSVAGQQSKIAVHRTRDGVWGRALGGMPTTHLLKPGIAPVDGETFPDQALIEHVTLSAARALGVPAVESEYYEFNGVPAVAVQRYDRVWLGETVARLHQEDLCQALGVGPEWKYEEQGGPGVVAIARFLDEVATDPAQSREFRLSFAMMVMFNHFSGSPDAHGKNYSILLLPDGTIRFAPMYDAASGLGFSNPTGNGFRFPRAAMRLGHQYRFRDVAEADWVQFARDLDLPFEVVRSQRDRMAASMPEAFRGALNDSVPVAARARILASPLLPRLEELCR
jgi:serine/threonine-protein kinase HipA